MDFKKTRKVITKLETLMDSFESIGEELSEIEISLLEKYIDDLKLSLPKPKVEESTEGQILVNEKTKVTKKPLTSKTSKENVVDHLQESPIQSEDFQDAPTEPISNIDDEIKVDESVSVDEEPVNKVSDQRLDALFTKSEVKELSDRLKLKPIKDIDKSLSINERILTRNELFDGDVDLMNATIATLNSLENYDEAIKYLKSNIALKLDWASESKKAKALQFLQIVQRRYM